MESKPNYKQQLKNARAEALRLLADRDYLTGFLKSVYAKLNNATFVKNSKPEIIANENAKKDDAESKIKAIDENLSILNKVESDKVKFSMVVDYEADYKITGESVNADGNIIFNVEIGEPAVVGVQNK